MVELIVRRLLPLAADGLADLRVGPDLIDRYMEILRARA